MNTKELAKEIQSRTQEIPMSQIEKIIGILVETITNKIKENEKVKIQGLGIFLLKERAERQGINPQTKEKLTIPACKTVKFKASSTIKQAVKQ